MGVGDVLVQGDLARTLEGIAAGGTNYFYRGEFAEAFFDTAKSLGGLYDGNEMRDQTAEIYIPPSVNYRDYQVFSHRPVSQGVVFLENLGILNTFDIDGLAPDDPDLVHLMVEIQKLTFADRNAHLGDPTFVDFPYSSLISTGYTASRAREVEWGEAKRGPVASGDPLGDTTYLCVVDEYGNACSYIHSLSHLFGSGVTVENTGVILNNRAGRGFTLQPDHPNCIAPLKRTMHTLNCYLVRDPGGGVWVGGTPGGDGQPQWNMQVLSHLIDGSMPPQRAVDFPRWTSFPGTDPANLGRSTVLRIEERFPTATMEDLRGRGHDLEIQGSWDGGGAAMLIGRPNRASGWMGGCDSRSGGAVEGF